MLGKPEKAQLQALWKSLKLHHGGRSPFNINDEIINVYAIFAALMEAILARWTGAALKEACKKSQKTLIYTSHDNG